MMTLARLANVAHSVSEADVRRLLEQSTVAGEGLYGWSCHGAQALYRIIEFNEDHGALQALLKRPEIDVNCRNKDGLTPLHVAALNNREIAVRLLLERRDLDVNATADFDLTPLHLAARLGHTQVLKQLFDDDSRLFLHAKTLHDFSALHMVAEGDEEFLDPYVNSRRASVEQRCLVVRLLRTEQEKRGLAGFEHFRDVFGRTALHYAAINGYVEMVRELLEFPYLNPNTGDNYGLTPLHLAVKHGHVSVSCLIMQAHLIDLDCRSGFRYIRHQVLPLQSYSLSSMIHLLYPVLSGDETSEMTITGVTPLQIAASGSHFDIFSALLSSKCCNVSTSDSQGSTALHYAVISGDVRAVKLLMDQPDVDFNCRDVDGMSPLELSVVHDRLEVLILLLGDHVNATVHLSEDVLRPSMRLLDIATRHRGKVGHGAIAHYLLDCLEECVRMSEGCADSTLAHWACQNGNMELMELVLAWKPEAANATNRKRQTPLHFAVIHGHKDLVLLLCLDKRLRATEVDKMGATPLDYAFEQGKQTREIQKILLRRDDVKEYMERIYRLDMNTINALFIGSTLFASVTYIAWMQPPAGLVEHYNFPLPSPPAPEDTYAVFANSANMYVKLFFIFNTIAFMFSLITIYYGIAGLASCRKQLDVGYVPRNLRSSIRYCYWYFVLATTFIIAAFENAGLAVLAPGELWYLVYILHFLWAAGGFMALIYSRKVIKRKLKRCWRAAGSSIQRVWSKKRTR